MDDLTKNELKVLAMIQGHGIITIGELKEKIFNGREDTTKKALNRLYQAGFLVYPSTGCVAWTEKYPK